MKKVLLVALVMVGTVAFAQKRHGDHKRNSYGSVDRMKQELSLTDDQYNKVKAINEKYASFYTAVRKDTSLTRGRAQGKMKSMNTEREAEIKKVLTADQWTKWTTKKSRSAMVTDRMKQKLSLNDDQYNKVKAINEKYASKYSTVKTEQDAELKKVLTPEQWTKWTDASGKKQGHRYNHKGGHFRGKRNHG